MSSLRNDHAVHTDREDWVVDLGDTWSEPLGSLDEAREMQAMWPGSTIYRRAWRAVE